MLREKLRVDVVASPAQGTTVPGPNGQRLAAETTTDWIVPSDFSRAGGG